MECNHKTFANLLSAYYKARQPVFVRGATGIGKSEGIRAFFMEKAKEMELDYVEWNDLSESEKLTYFKDADKRGKTLLFVDERVNLKDSTDNKGIPNLNDEEGYLKWNKTMIINVASQENANVIFFKDEMNLAPPSVMNSEYQWILDNAIDDISFARGVYNIAAGNRTEDKAQVNEMGAPLKNRFAHLTLTPPSVDEWTDWAIKNQIDSRIVAFINFRENYLFTFKEDMKDDAFSTPRSLARTSHLIKEVKDIPTIKYLSQSMLGDGVGQELSKFIELEMKIKLDDYLKNPKKLEELPANKMDIKHAILSSAVERYRKKPEVLKQAVAFVKHLPPQFAIYFLKMMRMTNQAHFRKEVIKTPTWEYIRDNYGKYLLEDK